MQKGASALAPACASVPAPPLARRPHAVDPSQDAEEVGGSTPLTRRAMQPSADRPGAFLQRVADLLAARRSRATVA